MKLLIEQLIIKLPFKQPINSCFNLHKAKDTNHGSLNRPIHHQLPILK